MSTNLTIWNNVVANVPAGIVSGVPIDLLTSAAQPNQNFNSIRLTIDYKSLTPDIAGAPFSIGAIIESKNDSGDWEPVAYQATDMKKLSFGPKRTIILQPNTDTFNLGIDEIIYVAGETLARITREPGALPQAEWRVRLRVKDVDPSGPNAFVSTTVSATAELYNV